MRFYKIDIQGKMWIQRTPIPGWLAADEGRVLYDTGGKEAYIGTNILFSKIWTNLNDGVGSGLDADLLDGREATYYENLPIGFIYPVINSNTPPLGSRSLECNGASLSRTTYADLFAGHLLSIGTRYGAVDANSFYLPDYRGRTLRGWSSSAPLRDVDSASRYADNPATFVPGITGNNVGSMQDDEFESHTHGISDDDDNTEPDSAGNEAHHNTGLVSTDGSWQSFMSIYETRMKNANVMWCIQYQ